MLKQSEASNMTAFELAWFIDHSNGVGEDFEMLSKVLAKKTMTLSHNTEKTLAHIAVTVEKAISEL